MKNRKNHLAATRGSLDSLGGCQTFFTRVKNTWQPLGIFWIENGRKCMAIAKHILIKNGEKRLVATNYFLDKFL
jgi:hypothetical protein